MTPDTQSMRGDLLTLSRNPLLARLNSPELEALFHLLDPARVAPEAYVVREGEVADAMYFLLSGEAELDRQGLLLRALGPGDHFGELGLIGRAPRATSVRAKTELRLASLSRPGYERLSVEHPHVALSLLTALVTSLGDKLIHMTDNVGALLRERSLARKTEVQVRRSGTVHRARTGIAIGSLLPSTHDGNLVVAALLDGKPVSLRTPVVSDASIAPLCMSSWEGRSIYRRSLGLVALEAARRIEFPGTLLLGPSLETAQVLEVPDFQGDLDPWVERLYQSMVELAKSDVPIVEELWTVEEARVHFLEHGWTDAAALLRTWRSATVQLVTCGTVYALSDGPLLPRAGALHGFFLMRHKQGMLLDFGDEVRRYATVPSPRRSLEPVVQEQRAPRYGGPMAEEHQRWLTAMAAQCVGAFNERCIDGQVAQLIRVAEGFHEKRIGRIADEIAEQRGNIRVVCVAGPSSSGKTTFIKRLMVQLEINGIHPVGISLDDYYVDREKTVRDEQGNLDYEALEALDIPLLHRHLSDLLRGETVKTPHYDFKSGLSRPGEGPSITLSPGNVLMLEGIHGLNPALVGDSVARSQAYRIFIHPATTLRMDRLSLVSPSDLRLLRRIVRDRHGRGISAAENIERWPSVQKGERLHIFPYMSQADTVFDSSLIYEPSVLRPLAERYLLEVPRGHASSVTAFRLRNLIDRFVTIHSDHVPPTSILREFVGGSTFEY